MPMGEIIFDGFYFNTFFFFFLSNNEYNRREPVVPNVLFTNTNVRLKHMFIIQFGIVAKFLANH